MSNLYELEFVPSNYYNDYFVQHQVGSILNIDSYLLCNYKNFKYDGGELPTSPLYLFKDLNYSDGICVDSEKYNNYLEKIVEHTEVMNLKKSRGSYFEYLTPIVRDGYNIQGEMNVNCVALFGKNYYGDDYVEPIRRFLGFLHFKNDYIPLYNTKNYHLQINASLEFESNFVGGLITLKEDQSIKIPKVQKYYNGDGDEIGINILNNIILD